MRVRITPARPVGEVRLPASKSAAHRALMAAAVTPGTTEIGPLPAGDDVASTLAAIRLLGAETAVHDEAVTVRGVCLVPGAGEDQRRVVDCGESGTTLRLLMPLFLAMGGETVFTGRGRLMERPMAIYQALCREKGIRFSQAGDRITVSGTLSGGDFSLPGDVSSQFISGLLLALPHLSGESRVAVTGSLQSAPYLEMTCRTLADFGYDVGRIPGGFSVPGGQGGRSPGRILLPTDQSTASFFGAVNTLGGRVRLIGESDDGLQADRVWKTVLPRLAAEAVTVSVSDCPDLAPILMTAAAACHGIHLTDTARLRFKESDRGETVAAELRKCGVAVRVKENEIFVSGGVVAPKEVLSCHNDHRVAMALGVLLTCLGGELEGAECVAKSFPAFWATLSSLGVPVETDSSCMSE